MTIIRFRMMVNKEDVAAVKDIVGMMIQIFMGDTIIAVAEVAMRSKIPTQNGSSKNTVSFPFTLSIRIPPKID